MTIKIERSLEAEVKYYTSRRHLMYIQQRFSSVYSSHVLNKN